MPVVALPPELLSKIFSHLSSSPQDLYHSLLVSRTFSELVKPILYRNITIESHLVPLRLLHARREDVRRIRKLTIRGCGDVYPSDLVEHFQDEHCSLGNFNLVERLLRGEWLDISVIETLHIRDVHEDPRTPSSCRDFKRAPNLVELSIWSHQGGAPLWSNYLNQAHLPQLRRLGFTEVSSYITELEEGYVNGEFQAQLQVTEVETQLTQDVPYSQLDCLVADCPTNFRNLSNFPFDNFLSISHPVSLQKQVKNSVVNFRPLYSRTDIWPSVDDWFENIQKLTIPSTNNHTIRFFFSGYPYRFGLKSYQEGLRSVQAKGFLVVDEIDAEEEARRAEEEGLDFERPEVDDLTSLIFPSFVNHLQQAGKLRDK